MRDTNVLAREVLKGVSPAQQVVKTVHDELVELLGARLQNLILGRQTRRNHARRSSGFGQDDFRGQAGQSFAQGQENPYLVPADVYRPAAIEQLKVLARQLEMPCYGTVPG